MKKVFLTLAVAFMAMAANAQVWMGGSFGLKSSRATETSMPSVNYSIAPEIGFSIAPRWDLAVGLNLAGTSRKTEYSDTKYASTSFSIQPYARFKAINCGKVGFFIDGGFEFGYEDNKVITGNHIEKNKDSYFMVGLKPGVSFAASDNITFAARIGSLGYYKQKDGESRVGINVNNADFTLGLWWTF